MQGTEVSCESKPQLILKLKAKIEVATASDLQMTKSLQKSNVNYWGIGKNHLYLHPPSLKLRRA